MHLDELAGERTTSVTGAGVRENAGGRQLRSIVVPAWVVVAIVSVLAVTVPRFGVPRIGAGFNPSEAVVPVGHELVQTFQVRALGLDELRLGGVEASANMAIDFEVGVWQGAVVTAFHRETVAFAGGAGARAVSFTFAPPPADKDLVYALRIYPRGPDASAHVTLKATEGHTYRDGALWLDRVELPLDLVMHADAPTAQPWRALAAMLRTKTDVPGLEWLFAVCYLGAVFLILRGLAQV